MHTEKVVNYNGVSLKELAQDIGNLKYDQLTEFFSEMGLEIRRQSENDAKQGHPKLANALDKLADKIGETVPISAEIWRICEPYMSVKKEGNTI